MLTYRVILTFLTACVTERGAGRCVCSVLKQFRIQRDSKVHKALSNRQSPVLWQMNRWCWNLSDAWKWQLWWWWDYGIPLWLVPRLTGLGGAQCPPAYVVPWSLGQWSPINIHKYPHCLYIVVLSSTTCSWAHLKCTLLSCSWWFENADKSRYWETPLIWFCCKIGNAIKEPLHQVQYSSHSTSTGPPVSYTTPGHNHPYDHHLSAATQIFMAERYSFLAAVQYSTGLYSTVRRWLYCTPPMVAAVGKPGTLQS